MSLVPILRLVVSAVPLFFLGVSGCAHNRVDLSAYAPQGPFPGGSTMQRSFVVAPLADHRFRFFEYGSTGMVDTVGWGGGNRNPLHSPEHSEPCVDGPRHPVQSLRDACVLRSESPLPDRGEAWTS